MAYRVRRNRNQYGYTNWSVEMCTCLDIYNRKKKQIGWRDYTIHGNDKRPFAYGIRYRKCKKQNNFEYNAMRKDKRHVWAALTICGYKQLEKQSSNGQLYATKLALNISIEALGACTKCMHIAYLYIDLPPTNAHNVADICVLRTGSAYV